LVRRGKGRRPVPTDGEPLRVRTPRDGNIRIGRIPGRMKKRVWMRVGDIVLVVPWEFQSDEKSDVVHRYRRNEVDWLEKRGILKANW
jgi:initiation factor 1A